MSLALVPGCMRRLAFESTRFCSICVVAGSAAAPPDGELGPIWISAGGGGLGSRGELGARAMVRLVCMGAACVCGSLGLNGWKTAGSKCSSLAPMRVVARGWARNALAPAVADWLVA